MPATRIMEIYSYPKDAQAEDKVLANATIKQIPYEVSDEQLAQEERDKAQREAIEEITQKKLAEKGRS